MDSSNKKQKRQAHAYEGQIGDRRRREFGMWMKQAKVGKRYRRPVTNKEVMRCRGQRGHCSLQFCVAYSGTAESQC